MTNTTLGIYGITLEEDNHPTKGHKPATTGKQDVAIIAFWLTLPIWVKGLALLLAL